MLVVHHPSNFHPEEICALPLSLVVVEGLIVGQGLRGIKTCMVPVMPSCMRQTNLKFPGTGKTTANLSPWNRSPLVTHVEPSKIAEGAEKPGHSRVRKVTV
jgi:hypothetical protein